tara:strand:+ start:3676 stop:5163 length:1488 start_codon:yes stop_codon:yes gene_type:complete
MLSLKSRDIQKINTWKFAGEFLWRKNIQKDQAKLGAWTRKKLIDLGPTFVKFGQIISTRSDLYSPAFTRELESLQDNVPPIDPIYVDDIVKKTPFFSEFENEPFKSASIGQVHKAKLNNGRDVVVKLRRPGIFETMKYDTDNVLEIVNFLEKIGVDTGTSTGYALNESIEYLLSETNYSTEMNNAIKMKTALKKIKWIKIPKIYEKYCTDDMIVMEYVKSTKLTEITDTRVNKKKICEALISSYMIQTMEKGLFHADPHPGNLGFSPEGKLVFYDFGLIINISDELKQGFKDIFMYIVKRDTKGIVDTLIKLQVIVPTTSDTSDIEIFFKTTLNYLETLDGVNLRDEIVNDEILLSLSVEKPFIIPTSFVYLAKAFSTIEGTCVRLDKKFNYYEYLEPLLRDEVMDSIDVRDMMATSMEMPSRIRNINVAVLGLEKSKSSMKRSLNKTRREIQNAQYSVLSALFAGNLFNHGNYYSFVFFSILTGWFVFISRKNR